MTERLRKLNPIDKSEFVEWLDNPVTQNLFEVLLREVEGVQKDLGEGGARREDPIKSAVAYHEGLGRQGGLVYPIQVDYEDLIEDE